LDVAFCACGDQESKETINRPIVDGMITDAPIELAGAKTERCPAHRGAFSTLPARITGRAKRLAS